jgi:hypothetical protein
MYQEQDMDVPIWKNHLLRMIHADPSKRPTITDLRQMQHAILRNIPLAVYSKKVHISGEETHKGSIWDVLSEKLN